MDTVKWAHTAAMEPDDLMVSDNLLEFVKDEDIATGLDNTDDILPQDIFNEIINKFDFNDNDVNINSFLNDFTTTDTNQLPETDFIPKRTDDPLLSSSNASINYNNLTPTTQIQTKPVIPQSNIVSSNPPVQLIASPEAVHITSPEMSNQLETVVYQIANNPITTNSFVTTSSRVQSQPTILSNLTPIQMVFNNVDTTNFQPIQEYTEVSETSPIVVQSGGLLSASKVVENNTKSIILSPTVVYTGATPVSTNSMQSVQLINTTNGTILTQMPVSTIMVEQEQERPPKVKEVKRSTHNAIERRYRTSINDKIVELKNMLVGEAGKLNKSAILKRSIEKITDLETENYELKLQNARLREILLAQGPIASDESSLKTLLLQKTVNSHKRRYTQSSIGSGSEYGNTSPPTSDESNPSLSPTHSDTGSIPLSPLGNDEISTEIDRSAKRHKKSRMDNITTHGMSSISKLTLCAFMFAIITINPLASLLSESSSSGAKIFEGTTGTSRRNILGVDIENINIFQTIWQRFSSSFLALFLNIIVLTMCLIKLCFHSDPVMNFRSPAADKYFKQKLIADTEFEQGNAGAAFIAYEKCLQMFGVVLPQSWFELIPMTIWQFLRCCAHRLRFGQWLSRKFGRIIRSDETQKDALNSAQELAIILNRCNQIHLSQDMRDGCGLILTMYAVNMAEVARNIGPLTLIDVYLTAALRCRKNYVYFFSWICSRYYLYKARSEAAMLCGQRLPPKYHWIFNSAYGYKYACKFSFDGITANLNSSTLFSCDANPLDTLSLVFASYNEHLLKCALQCLIGISYNTTNDIKTLECGDAAVIRDVLNFSALLKENCEDPLTLWWASLFSIDASWLLGDDDTADKMFESVRKMPKILRESKDPLARAAVTVFCAKKLLAMKQPGREQKIWSLCNCASKLFSESLLYNKTTKNDMILFVQLLICDWLLETRTSCWEMGQNTMACSDDDNNNYVQCEPLPSKDLEQFQNDLNSLYCIIDQIPTAKSRIYLYEAMSRLMAGAAPGYTQELLDRSFHEQYRRNNRSTFHCGSGNKENQNNNGTDTNATVNRRRCGQSSAISINGERERAAAIYVACKYLPTPLLCLPGERAGMLAEAAKTLKKIGNRKRLNDCYKLMQSFRATTVPANCN